MNALRLLPLLALAGCSWFGGGSAPAPETRPEYLACQSEARNSPEYRALGARGNVENPLNYGRVEPQRQMVETRLFRECLRRNGLALPGGVESVQRR